MTFTNLGTKSYLGFQCRVSRGEECENHGDMGGGGGGEGTHCRRDVLLILE
jgi:hypothetical protein